MLFIHPIGKIAGYLGSSSNIPEMTHSRLAADIRQSKNSGSMNELLTAATFRGNKNKIINIKLHTNLIL